MIGLCSVTFSDVSVEEIINLTKKADLQAIEWSSKAHVPADDIDFAKKVAGLMDKAGLETSSYGTYYVLGSFEDFNPYIEVAKVLGASTIRVWAGEKGSADTDSDERQKIVDDANRIGELAAKEDLRISLEYHAKTLTDTPESAIKLMEEINSPHVLLYWQPAESLTVDERLESLETLSQWVTNVHVFNWEDFYNRFPLADAFDEWKKYIDVISEGSPYEQNYLLEFVPGEDQEQGFYESAETLKKLVNE